MENMLKEYYVIAGICLIIALVLYYGVAIHIPSYAFGDFGCNATKLVRCFG